MIEVNSWGRLSSPQHHLIPLNNRYTTKDLIIQCHPGLAYGMGRSYGDECLNPNGFLWTTRGLNKFITFNDDTGLLVCESGILLSEINDLFIPRGWMLPVIPGTQEVTVGGAIANDVHGKNHQVFGTFSHHIKAINLLRTTGEMIECGPQLKPDWFAATVGGLGLTGLILTAELQLRPVNSAYLETETIPFEGLEQYFQCVEESVNWEYTVSWVNGTTGKKCQGLFLRGKHSFVSEPDNYSKHRWSVPFTPPLSLVNKVTLPLLNKTYYYLKSKYTGPLKKHYKDFLCPLDTIGNWNKLYGPRGFYQHQSLVPLMGGAEIIRTMLHEISEANEGSWLTVLKTFGDKKSLGLLSFSQEGVSLAMDFPNKGETTIRVLNRLDKIVQEAEGRIYLAKDCRMSAEYFASSYPQSTSFLNYRDPGISSAMSRRLMGL